MEEKIKTSQKWPVAFRALRHYNYRLYFGGQLISLTGTWMQNVALSWLAYRLTGSSTILGLISFLGLAPSLLFAAVAGVVADRTNKHRLIVAMQSLAMLQAAALAVLALAKVITLWQIFLLAVFNGLIRAFDIPARQAFIVEMVDRSDLINAISLNSSVFNGARIIGPTLAGMVVAAFGEGVCFALNAVSFLAVIAALLVMKLPEKTFRESREPFLKEMLDGFHYALNFLPVRNVLLLLGVIALFGTPYTVLLPVFVRQIFSGSAKELGFLMSAAGAGALVGAFYLGTHQNPLRLPRLIWLATGFLGCGLMGLGFSRLFPLSLLLVAVIGFSAMLALAASNSLVQSIVEDDKRGRVMSLHTTVNTGLPTFGNLLAGVCADSLGAPVTVTAGGIVCLLTAILFTITLPGFRRVIRPLLASPRG
ncbi:MAG TPA: MFS transporter [bacterium]|nr:MFS transporter [bacterium]HOL67262.1 MFS transporter [bacterium]HPP12885.1 MFS transporter [bacterium]